MFLSLTQHSFLTKVKREKKLNINYWIEYKQNLAKKFLCVTEVDGLGICQLWAYTAQTDGVTEAYWTGTAIL